MSRRSKPERRIPSADPVYNSVDVSKFINRVMRRGKKSLAEKIFYATIAKIEEKTNEKGLEIFQKAITNATPLLEVKARRIGGSTYQVPIDVKQDRGFEARNISKSANYLLTQNSIYDKLIFIDYTVPVVQR